MTRTFAHWLDAWDAAARLVKMTEEPVRIVRIEESLLLDSLIDPKHPAVEPKRV
jgi:hypothetical protein